MSYPALVLILFLLFQALRLVRLSAGGPSIAHRAYIFLRFTLFPNLDPPGFENYSRLLSGKISYFNVLNDKEQRRFVDRLQYIRDQKVFTSREEDFAITEEMTILLSASLTQVTFGLSQFDIAALYSIELTSASFYSRLIGRQVKGLTFESGRIILSWADFEEGYKITNDKLNLGIHELGHSLWMFYFEPREFEAHFTEWNTAALSELQSIRTGTDSRFLRSYATTNIEEFWACTLECFFEAPVEFKTKIPPLYAATAKVLQQDLAAKFNHG